jgi:hypothetical protein
MHSPRFRWINVKPAAGIVHAHQISFFDPEHAREPTRNADLEKFTLYLRDAPGAFDQLTAPSTKRDEQDQLSAGLQDRPFQRQHFSPDDTSSLCQRRLDGNIRLGTLGALSIELLADISQVGFEPTTSLVSGEVTLSYTTSNFVASRQNFRIEHTL